MSARTALLIFLGFIVLSQLLAARERSRVQDQREAATQTARELAHGRAWSAEAPGGVGRLDDAPLGLSARDAVGEAGDSTADVSWQGHSATSGH